MKAPQLSSPRRPLRKKPLQRRPSSNLTVIIEVNLTILFHFFLAKDIFALSENQRVPAAAAAATIQTRTLT